MASSIAKSSSGVAPANDDAKDAQAILHQNRSNEIWLGVVGPVGAGGSHAIKALEKACGAAGYKVEPIKMSDLIRTWAIEHELDVPSEGIKTLKSVEMMQNLGDEIRKRDPAGVARLCLAAIAAKRAERTGKEFKRGEMVEPDQEKRAYLIDSIRHPLKQAYSVAHTGMLLRS